MPIIRVGVQAVTGSSGQPVDFDAAFVSLTTITNNSAEACQYSTDAGSTWTTISAGASASPGITASSLLLRKSSAGAYPIPVDVSFSFANGIVGSDGSLMALSEVSPYVNATASAGATVFSGACELAGWYCSVAAGNITIYDALSATGTPIVPTTALVAGPMPIFGAGTNGRMALATGCHVVLSGAATVRVLVG